ncbi:MAG: cell division protein ZipA C-terminal FtsZ-binding domain-containing protein [Gammaproteobacteria bacterium]
MEYLRWILLLAGILFIAVLYFMGRQRRRNDTYSDGSEFEDDLPQISARDLDDIDEGVGNVRVVTRFDDDEVLDDFSAEPPEAQQPDQQKKSPQQTTEKASASPDDLVTLYLMAKDELLSGDMINSAAYANGLTFGEMNIFHRLDENEVPLYSLANMMEPGNFDPKDIHKLRTRGLVLFIQLAHLKYPVDALHDMLRCAYRMADMIEARLCNDKRQPLTEQDANAYRALAAKFDGQS